MVWGCLDPHFGSGIPESVWGFIVWCIPILVRGSPFWYGDVLIPILVRGSPNRFGDSFEAHPHSGLGIHLKRIPISVWGSPFWYGDSGIPILVWLSQNRFGDSFDAHPHRFGGPRFGMEGLGIPKSVRGYPNQFGDSCNAHPHFGMGIPEPIQDPQTDMGIPKLKWGVPVLILSHSVHGVT